MLVACVRKHIWICRMTDWNMIACIVRFIMPKMLKLQSGTRHVRAQFRCSLWTFSWQHKSSDQIIEELLTCSLWSLLIADCCGEFAAAIWWAAIHFAAIFEIDYTCAFFGARTWFADLLHRSNIYFSQNWHLLGENVGEFWLSCQQPLNFGNVWVASHNSRTLLRQMRHILSTCCVISLLELWHVHVDMRCISWDILNLLVFFDISHRDILSARSNIIMSRIFAWLDTYASSFFTAGVAAPLAGSCRRCYGTHAVPRASESISKCSI